MLAHGLRVQVHRGREIIAAAPEAAGHTVSAVSKQRLMKACARLPFYSVQDICPWNKAAYN